MTCRIADNQPLKNLRKDLGAPPQCHSLREHCIQNLHRQLGGFTMGGSGAALGYCQALFNRTGPSDSHTRAVIQALADLAAPWPKSHELFWGYRRDESASVFLEKALAPLSGSGRVPVLITGLDPAADEESIMEILKTSPPIVPGETILIRMVLKSEDSIKPTGKLIGRLLDSSRADHKMPLWWPLLQGDFSPAQWQRLRDTVGDAWRYLNFAINPFTPLAVFEKLAEQITVAQFVIGLTDGISSTGQIILPPEMRILGAPDQASYDVFRFAGQLQMLPNTPTCILLGPALLNSTMRENCDRLRKFLPLFREAANILWHKLDRSSREMIWRLTA